MTASRLTARELVRDMHECLQETHALNDEIHLLELALREGLLLVRESVRAELEHVGPRTHRSLVESTTLERVLRTLDPR